MVEDSVAPRLVINKVGIVGCGPMGAAYTQVCAQKGYKVVVSGKTKEHLNKGLSLIETRLKESADKGNLSKEEKYIILDRIKGTTNQQDFEDCDLVIENVTERMDVKKTTFAKLDEICPKDILLCTNMILYHP